MSSLILEVSAVLDSAHKLVSCVPEDHKCRNLHGHTYRVAVLIYTSGEEFVGKPVVVETGLVTAAVMKFDHCYLNDKFKALGKGWEGEETTIENLAIAIFMQVDKVLPKHAVVQSVRVQEGDGASVTYYAE